MRTWNFGKNGSATVFFRLCLVTIVALTLVMGGMALNIQPVHAATVIPLFVTATFPACQSWSQTFTVTPACTPSFIFFWLVGTLPGFANLDPLTGKLTACPQPTDVGVYNFSIICTEMYWPGPCWPPIHMTIPVTLTVTPPLPTTPLTINATYYPVAWEGLPFTMTLSGTGCSGNYNWTATGLPAGITVTDAALGIISGTPAPGTCGTYTVTVTCTDTLMCPTAACCPPVSRPFLLIVDCWANYPPIFYYTTACDFTVEIGPGLTQGQANVLVDGTLKATLVGGQKETFTSVPCESHLVMVDQTVQVPNSNTRFSIIGSNTKTVSDIDNYAYFNYGQEVFIQTASEPSGVTQPPGTGFYVVGSNFSSTAPGTIETDIQNGIKYVFWQWGLPDGTTRPTGNLLFAVNQGGTAVAKYKTYYQLILKSDYPPIDERSFEPAGSTATWNLSLHAVPVEGGFWRFLGATQTPVNASGQQIMNGPATVEILWRPNYTGPIVAIVIVLLVIAGLIILVVRLRSKPPAKPVATTRVRKASSRTRK